MKKELRLFDLPKKEVSIALKSKFKRRLFKDFLSNFNNSPALAEKYLKTNRANIRYWRSSGQRNNGKTKSGFTESSIPLWALINMSKFLLTKGFKNYSQDNVEKQIKGIKHRGGKFITNPKLPICLETKEMAIITAALLGDGGIGSNKLPMYNNSELCMRKKVVNAINKSIGKVNIDPKRPYKNNAINFPKLLTVILKKGFNFKIGDKVTNNPSIPKQMLKTKNKEVIYQFLQQIFDDEGSAYIDKRKQGAISLGLAVDVSNHNRNLIEKIKKKRLSKYAPRLLKDIKTLLEKVGLAVNGPYFKKEYLKIDLDKKRPCHAWGIQLQGKRNLEKYRKNINFLIKRKRENLEKILNNYKQIEHGTSLRDSLQRVMDLNNKGLTINIYNFMKERGCKLNYARSLLKNLKEKGFIEVKNKGKYLGWHKGYAPYEYKLVNN